MKAWAKSEGYWCRGGPNISFRWSLSVEFRGWEGQHPEGKVERTSQLRVVLEMICSRGLTFDYQSLGWNNRVDLLQGTGDQKVEGAENYLSEARISSPGTGVRGIVNFRVGSWTWTRVLCRRSQGPSLLNHLPNPSKPEKFKDMAHESEFKRKFHLTVFRPFW